MKEKVINMLKYCHYMDSDIGKVIDEIKGNSFIESVASYYDRTWYLSKKQDQIVFKIVNEYLSNGLYKEINDGIL